MRSRPLTRFGSVAVYLLRGSDHPTLPAATRAMVARPKLAIAMIKDVPATSE